MDEEAEEESFFRAPTQTGARAGHLVAKEEKVMGNASYGVVAAGVMAPRPALKHARRAPPPSGGPPPPQQRSRPASVEKKTRKPQLEPLDTSVPPPPMEVRAPSSLGSPSVPYTPTTPSSSLIAKSLGAQDLDPDLELRRQKREEEYELLQAKMLLGLTNEDEEKKAHVAAAQEKRAMARWMYKLQREQLKEQAARRERRRNDKAEIQRQHNARRRKRELQRCLDIRATKAHQRALEYAAELKLLEQAERNKSLWGFTEAIMAPIRKHLVPHAYVQQIGENMAQLPKLDFITNGSPRSNYVRRRAATRINAVARGYLARRTEGTRLLNQLQASVEVEDLMLRQIKVVKVLQTMPAKGKSKTRQNFVRMHRDFQESRLQLWATMQRIRDREKTAAFQLASLRYYKQRGVKYIDSTYRATEADPESRVEKRESVVLLERKVMDDQVVLQRQMTQATRELAKIEDATKQEAARILAHFVLYAAAIKVDEKKASLAVRRRSVSLHAAEADVVLANQAVMQARRAERARRVEQEASDLARRKAERLARLRRRTEKQLRRNTSFRAFAARRARQRFERDTAAALKIQRWWFYWIVVWREAVLQDKMSRRLQRWVKYVFQTHQARMWRQIILDKQREQVLAAADLLRKLRQTKKRRSYAQWLRYVRDRKEARLRVARIAVHVRARHIQRWWDNALEDRDAFARSVEESICVQLRGAVELFVEYGDWDALVVTLSREYSLWDGGAAAPLPIEVSSAHFFDTRRSEPLHPRLVRTIRKHRMQPKLRFTTHFWRWVKEMDSDGKHYGEVMAERNAERTAAFEDVLAREFAKYIVRPSAHRLVPADADPVLRWHPPSELCQSCHALADPRLASGVCESCGVPRYRFGTQLNRVREISKGHFFSSAEIEEPFESFVAHAVLCKVAPVGSWRAHVAPAVTWWAAVTAARPFIKRLADAGVRTVGDLCDARAHAALKEPVLAAKLRQLLSAVDGWLQHFNRTEHAMQPPAVSPASSVALLRSEHIRLRQTKMGRRLRSENKKSPAKKKKADPVAYLREKRRALSLPDLEISSPSPSPSPVT